MDRLSADTLTVRELPALPDVRDSLIFTGLVWVEHLANGLGVPLTDYAVGGGKLLLQPISIQ